MLELPRVKAYDRGPVEVEKLLAGLLAKVPDFRFKNLIYFIQTPDKVAAEYQVEAQVLATGKMYRQTYTGVLHAESGKIKLLHETLNTLVVSEAFPRTNVCERTIRPLMRPTVLAVITTLKS